MKNLTQKLNKETKDLENHRSNQNVSTGNPPNNQRRDFVKKVALGGMSLSAMYGMSMEDTIAQSTSKVNLYSNPSELRITDLRYTTLDNGTSYTNARNVIIRIDTNQGIYGLGELRDGADPRYGLFLKSRLLGLNPCNVEMIFKIIKQFGGHGRKAGGVSGVEMALWDLVGKAYNVPVWQLLGGKYREKVRLYAYVPAHDPTNMDVEKFKKDCKVRIEEQGFTWLKMHPGIQVYADVPGATVNTKYIPGFKDRNLDNYISYQNTRHALTSIMVTDKGLDILKNYVSTIRDIVGYDIPLSGDHFGHFDVNECIRVANALESYRLASMEDMVPWDSMDQLKMITDSINSPTITGEDIFGKESFAKLCDMHAVDIVHPDMGTSGGILETKKIGDYAEERDVSMKMHFAGTPISFMANVHCAAATQNFLALEMPVQCVDNPWWPKLVKMVGKQELYTKGFANVPSDAPGLGVELNEDEIKKHLHDEDKSYFAPTPKWNEKRSHDRLWS
ncbi:mandelate racemase/muconate lactonizing enzyme family protein [Aurantibacter crassamenti]|uniref:mandelate racemase/muconate lactonizing enzyme family protein n=1 Tax=Aurantibacter crassamenti TaxID=1837375 RepID=UPI00193979A8|nr:mandelate racemase/muconate lactonizing enzyme family protein [Aurantibacter crassamenti]MBM1106794.1 mandelate racemase/muconate lactonizing enzyme family protein [Aurantibacter crassamenti]